VTTVVNAAEKLTHGSIAASSTARIYSWALEFSLF
jgi:hypothetical protein